MILVVDVGTTSVRAAVMTPEGSIAHFEQRPSPPDSPFPGLVEFDAEVMAATVIDLCNSAIRQAGPVSAVGVTTQRASTIAWNRTTGRPLASGLGWQDLRTVGDCLTIGAEHGVQVAPNQTATKAKWLLNTLDESMLNDVCIGTVDSWVVWALSSGTAHITDHTNAAVTGLYSPASGTWDDRLCTMFGVPMEMLPTIVDSVGECAHATALTGAPPIVAVVGDQQGSLVGQGCVAPGPAKITFGTGGMLDLCVGDDVNLIARSRRGEHGCFGIVAWSESGRRTFGAEAIMLAAGSNIDWLRDDLRIVSSSAETHTLAATCETSEGVIFVPAPLGLGTPHWDYGARSTLVGLTRGSTAAHVVRAVLEGVAHRGADLVEAAERDTGISIEVVRVDGGMSKNPTFVQALADFTGRTVEVSPHAEGTTIGAGRLALVGSGQVHSVSDTSELWEPSETIVPRQAVDRNEQRGRWAEAVARSSHWIPELSGLDF